MLVGTHRLVERLFLNDKSIADQRTTHVQEPVIMSAGWENMSGGTIIARHEYKGLSKMTAGALEDWVERQKLETSHASNGPRHSSRHERRNVIPGAYHEPDEHEDIY